MPLFDIHVIVDWSARSAPSPARPTGDAIWYAVAEGGVVGAPEYVRTRGEAVARLADLVASWRDAGKRVLIGFDFPFGYPEGVAERLTGRAEAYALWDWVAARVNDRPDNGNDRYRAAEEINAAYEGLGPCWGRPATWDVPGVPVGAKARFGGDHPPERRRADAAAKGAKTVWQLAYSGSVGSQVLLGLPALKRLREDARLREHLAVWPFDTGLRAPDAPLVIAEIYPSLFADAVQEGQRDGEIKDAAQVRITAEAFAALDAAGGLAPVFSGPSGLSAADRRVIETEEAWILGLG
ncbi:MAG: precorrin-8X methylmutase, partial [Pseudomonadota bacterium]